MPASGAPQTTSQGPPGTPPRGPFLFHAPREEGAIANCQIVDAYGYTSATGTFTGIEGGVVYAAPDASWRTFDVGAGVYRPLGNNPNINSVALQRGRFAVTATGGSWEFDLPYPAASHPASPTTTWSIQLPTGDIWSGEVPAVAGPLTLDDLRLTYGWVQLNQVYVAPVTPGTLVRGTATFTAASTASILFTSAFASSAYQIFLTPSVDSGTGGVPTVGWDNKTTSGFDIVTSGVFTGSVDYEAVL